MSLSNTSHRYGPVARGLHWLVAVLIVVSWGLGYWAEGLAFDTPDALALKVSAFSWHQTLGIMAFFLALMRVIWALFQPHPHPVSPEHRAEVWMATMVHWLLYVAMLLVPLTGWIHHAATSGFAPVLLPFGDDLPLIPKSEQLAHLAGAAHVIFVWLIFVAVGLHVAGALKHVVVDRDVTLARMLRGTEGGRPGPQPVGARGAAIAIWAVAAALAFGGALQDQAPVPTQGASSAPTEAAARNWTVESGTLDIAVRQMGAEVQGRFEKWQADIQFDPQWTEGNHVTVRIDVASLKLGSVSAQATGPEFLDAPVHPEAVWQADIRPEGAGWRAEGPLVLHGVEAPFVLDFDLVIEMDQARMKGTGRIDRRAFEVGRTYGDEKTVGFDVPVTVELVARRLN